ncbi:transcriptional regulator, IclR family protein [Pseudooceanicola batsensis HTCC2597]|uniref:Transcriptional regulator, IclR family protein n=1 Tax=Pseudooceanicola batsensis (strain ATCC BAA-863 / DSM 15984 / KCTC 12145 / HTCC2597) TaxID=252305 RepID=A3U0Y1_PSEBH|nr:IclR family transcriptional regulator C-terminal domain-containing protein [Pseudooceanicola batsensis]EAQ02422.1 transcriptional regulator, IclR family protein [Pseudooceanicola batsensis HTCC2597]
MTKPADKPTEFVDSLAKGLAILESFDASRPEMTLSEVAKTVNLSPAAARRSLITLEHLGFIGRNGKRFHLTPRILTLGSSFYAATRIEEVLQPELRGLIEKFGDASSIGTLDGHDVIYIAHVSVQRARRASANVGARYPAFATSMGRVLVAGMTDEKRRAWLSDLRAERLTSKTCIDPCRLGEEIEKVRENGYATTVDQLDYGITAIAVPVRNAEGDTVAALNSSGYTGLVTPEQLVEERLPELRATASHIAHQITRYPVLGSVLAP